MSSSEDSNLDPDHAPPSQSAIDRFEKEDHFFTAINSRSGLTLSDRDGDLLGVDEHLLRADNDRGSDYDCDRTNNRVVRLERDLHEHDLLNLDIEEKEYEKIPSYHIRPNRYYGPPSSWRTWTKHERSIADSFHLLRSRDLSVHLFNAHVLHSQVRDSEQVRIRNGKQKAVELGRAETGALFVPPKVWTAWPMSPEEVPREDQLEAAGGRDSKTTFCAPRDLRPSAVLEDCLVATTLRIAREGWEARRWEEEPSTKSKPTESPHILTQTVQQHCATTVRSGSEEQAQVDPASRESTPNEADDIPKVQMFSSQAFNDSDGQESQEKESDGTHDDWGEDLYSINHSDRPVPIAEDDKARKLITPSVRHILSNLDKLLTGLHHARQAYAAPYPDSADSTSEAGSETRHSALASTSRKRGRSRSIRYRASSMVSNAAVDSENSATSSASRKRTNMRTAHSTPHDVQIARLGLRDWSDVLGMAALTGWDEKIVARAGERCAGLFKEDMLFRNFHESEHGGGVSFTEALATGRESMDELGESDATIPMISKAGEFPQPMQQDHPCPDHDCPRYKIPFHRPEDLQRHMYQHDARPQFPEAKIGISTSGLDSQATMQPTGIFCPLKTCQRNQEGFSKGAKLYSHVRKMHPDMNVENLKKLESRRRGESRGKWVGERRNRNPYDRR